MSNNSQFNIEVGTVLNTSNVPKQLKNLNAQLQKSNSKIVLRADGSQVLKTVNTLKDAIGNLYKQTQVVDPFSGLQIDNKINQVTENIKILTTETHKFVDSKGAINTWTTTVDSAGQKIQTRVREMNDGFGTITKTIDKYGRNAQGQFTKLDNTITTITQDEIKYAQAQAQANKQTQKSIVQNKQLGQSFGDIITKVTKYYVATFPMRAVQTAVRETIEAVKEFDDALVEFRKVSDLSGESLQNYIDKLSDLGKITGSTIKDMVEAST